MKYCSTTHTALELEEGPPSSLLHWIYFAFFLYCGHSFLCPTPLHFFILHSLQGVSLNLGQELNLTKPSHPFLWHTLHGVIAKFGHRFLLLTPLHPFLSHTLQAKSLREYFTLTFRFLCGTVPSLRKLRLRLYPQSSL